MITKPNENNDSSSKTGNENISPVLKETDVSNFHEKADSVKCKCPKKNISSDIGDRICFIAQKELAFINTYNAKVDNCSEAGYICSSAVETETGFCMRNCEKMWLCKDI